MERKKSACARYASPLAAVLGTVQMFCALSALGRVEALLTHLEGAFPDADLAAHRSRLAAQRKTADRRHRNGSP